MSKPLVLSADKRYLISYYNKTHDSVFDIELPTSYKSTETHFFYPLKHKDIEIELSDYSYYKIVDGKEFLYIEGGMNSNSLRGLLIFDMKYWIDF